MMLALRNILILLGMHVCTNRPSLEFVHTFYTILLPLLIVATAPLTPLALARALRSWHLSTRDTCTMLNINADRKLRIRKSSP